MQSLCAGLRADPGIKTKDEWWQLPAPLDITLVYVPYDQRGAKKKGATYYSNIIYFPEIGLAWVLQSSSAPLPKLSVCTGRRRGNLRFKLQRFCPGFFYTLPPRYARFFLLHPKPFFNAVYDVWHAEPLSLTRAWKPSVPSRLILGGASFSETYRTLGIAQHKMSIGIEVSICYSSGSPPPPQLSYYASLLQTPQRVH